MCNRIRQTKIVATVSDRRCDGPFLQRLLSAGANVFRLNTAHQEPTDTIRVIEAIRSCSRTVPIMLDTKGPELRTTAEMAPRDVIAGERVFVTGDADCPDRNGVITVNYRAFTDTIEPHCRILFDDGSVALRVEERQGNALSCIVEHGGTVAARKSVNVPGVHLDLPTLNARDHEFLDLAAHYDIDFIAHSFVRCRDDVETVKTALRKRRSQAAIIAKIENAEGIANVDEILTASYGLMVARGDLGIELAAERIPAIQKRLIALCRQQNKPVIVATQMLQSMIVNPRATRAEVSDVANAVYDGTDAIMLSGETAHGAFPIEAVETMARIARHSEVDRMLREQTTKNSVSAAPMFLAETAIRATEALPVSAVVTDTTTGRTARYLSAHRGQQPVYARCYGHRLTRQLALSYGIHPEFMERHPTTQQFLGDTVRSLVQTKTVEPTSLLVVIAGNFGPDHGASFVEIASAERILRENPAADGSEQQLQYAKMSSCNTTSCPACRTSRLTTPTVAASHS